MMAISECIDENKELDSESGHKPQQHSWETPLPLCMWVGVGGGGGAAGPVRV